MTHWNIKINHSRNQGWVWCEMCFCLCFKWCRILCLSVLLAGVVVAAFLVISLTRNPSLVLRLLKG
jgi:hypothetical protein